MCSHNRSDEARRQEAHDGLEVGHRSHNDAELAVKAVATLAQNRIYRSGATADIEEFLVRSGMARCGICWPCPHCCQAQGWAGLCLPLPQCIQGRFGWLP